MPPVQVVRTYLEMSSPDALRPAAAPAPAPRLERVEACPVSFFRYLYAEVGRAFHWTDRLTWDDAKVQAHLADPANSLWLLTWRAAPAGGPPRPPPPGAAGGGAALRLLSGYFAGGGGGGAAAAPG